MKRKLDGRYKKNVDSGTMSHLKLDLPLKAYKKTEPDESEGRSVIGNKKKCIINCFKKK
jgi:hypothetical protein